MGMSSKNTPAKAENDILAQYRKEYGPEMGDGWREILLDMAAMADGQGHADAKTCCEVASKMPTREMALAVLTVANGDNGYLLRVLGLM